MHPLAKKIKLVMDNFKTHVVLAFYEVFEPEKAKRLWNRFEFVLTPKHGSWLNIAEIELPVLIGQCLNRHIDSIDKVTTEIIAWQNHRKNKECQNKLAVYK
jgi:hypothetical protein